ncbi:2' O-ribose methyltransferase [Perkinsus olseni]|nr:2' O-ribose methyltransferase [Perkinsus olseni]
MLPPYSQDSSYSSLMEYLRRMFHKKQMDLEYTFSQMVYLCIAPRKVCQLTIYRHQTKGRWSRDDPAFVVIQVLFLAVSGIAYGVCFSHTFLQVLRVFLIGIVVHFLLLGSLVAAVCNFIANRHLRVRTFQGLDQRVPFLYSFDVHCNAFFPTFLLLYVVQYFLFPLLLSDRVVSCIFGNALCSIALMYYCYITCLGYSTLPFIRNAQVFLYPAIVGLVIAVVFTVTRTNLSVKFFHILGVPPHFNNNRFGGSLAKRWLDVRMHDMYVRRAQRDMYRSRAAYKLLQLDDRFSIFRKNQRVVDLGCYSGGWSQVALKRTRVGESDSVVIGVDKVRMDALQLHTFVQGDITEPSTIDAVKRALGENKKAHVLLSDMAPNVTGRRTDDHLEITELNMKTLDVMESILGVKGWLVMKTFFGPETQKLRTFLESRFYKVQPSSLDSTGQVVSAGSCI